MKPFDSIDASSFRDPAGFVFYKNGQIYRQVNKCYQDNYNFMMSSGLYQSLVEKKLLLPFVEESRGELENDSIYKIIKPQTIPFISYPYEWTFEQLRDAALLSLEIQKISLSFGMSLKDCSVYNVQFLGSRPIFIDSLSFEKYEVGSPWCAYKQFCQHFLAPLALMSYTDLNLGKLMQTYIDGIPLPLTSNLLPFRSMLRFGILMNIHLHAKSQEKYSKIGDVKISHRKMSKFELEGLVHSLRGVVSCLRRKKQVTEWGDYYSNNNNYNSSSMQGKESLVREWLIEIKPTTVWDIGANEGNFSQIASELGAYTISSDIDHVAVETNYKQCKVRGDRNCLPLLLDITNPSSGIGWANTERSSFVERNRADTILALALIHHLAISQNIPFSKIASFFSSLAKNIIIEFVPKEDSMVQKLLSSRVDIFSRYTENDFEIEFLCFFTIEKKIKIDGSERILYHLKVRS